LTALGNFADIIAQFSYFNQIESLLVSNQALEDLFATKLSKQTLRVRLKFCQWDNLS